MADRLDLASARSRLLLRFCGVELTGQLIKRKNLDADQQARLSSYLATRNSAPRLRFGDEEGKHLEGK